MLVYFPWNYQKSRVYECSIYNETNKEYIEKIREWIIYNNPSKNNSTHIWYKDLPNTYSKMFYDLANSQNIIDMFKKNLGDNYCIDLLNDMNEIYVTPPPIILNNITSDNIFYTKHIDGPFYLFPFASCYRLIIGLDNNSKVITSFNMIPQLNIVKKGDVVAFDFHRECHYIYDNTYDITNKNNTHDSKIVNKDDGLSDNFRIILKVHYCVYPKWAYYFGKILGKISIYYDKCFRNLFLFTLISNKLYKKYLSYIMIYSTLTYHNIEYYIGYNNISFLTLLYIISCYTNYNVFLFGSSYIHYFRWINSIKNNCDNLSLARDYRFYYFTYIIQLYYIYYQNITKQKFLITNVINLITIVYQIDNLKDINKIFEIFMLILLYLDYVDKYAIENLYLHLHLVMNIIESNLLH